jgi:hypothetical protein
MAAASTRGLRQSLVLLAARVVFAPSLARRIAARTASARLPQKRRSALRTINAPRDLIVRRVAALNPKATYA